MRVRGADDNRDGPDDTEHTYVRATSVFEITYLPASSCLKHLSADFRTMRTTFA
jgi:hypothetical protein